MSASNKKKLRKEQTTAKMTERQTQAQKEAKQLKRYTAAFISVIAIVLVVAIGKADFVTGDMVKEGAVVIDVGIHRDANNKLCGDVDFDDVVDHVSYITPVPKGVGPMTIAMLMENTLEAYGKRTGEKL